MTENRSKPDVLKLCLSTEGANTLSSFMALHLSSGLHLGFLKPGTGQHLQHADKPKTSVLLLQRVHK